LVAPKLYPYCFCSVINHKGCDPCQ
jgi:hypothetical protein